MKQSSKLSANSPRSFKITAWTGLVIALLVTCLLLFTRIQSLPEAHTKAGLSIKKAQSHNTVSPKTSNTSTHAAVSPGTSNEPVHANITTTVFWAGEPASSDNGYIANDASAWDGQWQKHAPQENPFYVALPYDDIDDAGQRKPTARLCPYSKQPEHYSWCKNAWIAVHYGSKVAYAQWEDVGPYQEDDVAYVFGSSRPSNQIDTKAGLDVSPSVRDYLALGDVSYTSWNFVSASAVPSGPWHQIITSSAGDSID